MSGRRWKKEEKEKKDNEKVERRKCIRPDSKARVKRRSSRKSSKKL